MIEFHRIWAFILRHVYELKASLDRKAEIFLFPVVDILTFGLLSRYISQFDVRSGIALAILGAIIFWTLLYNIQRDISFFLLEDAWSRNLYNLFSTPLKLAEMVIGTLCISVMKAILTICIVLGLAQSLFHFNIFHFGLAMVFYLFNIFLFAWAFGYMTASLILRFGTKAQSLAWSLILVIYPLSGVFYPLSVLPRPLAQLAQILPISHVFEGLRAIIMRGVLPQISDLLIILVLNFVYFALGLTFFSRGFQSAKSRGWFIHPT